MIHESEENGTERKPNEQRKQPYEKPTVTRHLVTSAERDRLIEQNDKSKAAGGKG